MGARNKWCRDVSRGSGSVSQRRDSEPELAKRLRNPWILDNLIALGRERGLVITEEDVFLAQQREESSVSSSELQQRMADESRRLRHFIPG